MEVVYVGLAKPVRNEMRQAVIKECACARAFARLLIGARARGGFLCFSLKVLDEGGWVANLSLKTSFIGSSELRYLHSLSQHSMVLSLTTI